MAADLEMVRRVSRPGVYLADVCTSAWAGAGPRTLDRAPRTLWSLGRVSSRRDPVGSAQLRIILGQSGGRDELEIKEAVPCVELHERGVARGPGRGPEIRTSLKSP